MRTKRDLRGGAFSRSPRSSDGVTRAPARSVPPRGRGVHPLDTFIRIAKGYSTRVLLEHSVVGFNYFFLYRHDCFSTSLIRPFTNCCDRGTASQS